MKIIFFGPPGCGKGTYASRIAPQLGIAHIATGDLFRAEVAAGTKLGRLAEKYMKAGGLVPDDVVIKMFKERIAKRDCSRGFILDGFPRTVEQMKGLEKITRVDIVINLILPDDVIIEKALARRVCEKCGNIYNIAHIKRQGIDLPPIMSKKKDTCDKCGSRLMRRKDDNEATIKERLEVYRQQSTPLLEYYKKKNLVKKVKVVGPPEAMVPIIMKVLGKK